MRFFNGYVAGMILGFVMVIGCASTSFPWRFYNEQMDDTCYDKGMLLGKLGKDGWKDIPLSECKPDGSAKEKCTTLLVDDFYSLKADDEKCHIDLQDCQKGPKP